ncbi:MAG: hypothetical protein O7E54_03735 [Planctomycetota bacterium]|nr:hypothetical protein [Planctomycetota bacterium]
MKPTPRRTRTRATAWALLLSCFVLASCGGDDGVGDGTTAAGGGWAVTADRATWWTEATVGPVGSERIFCPRELRALLDEGVRAGFHKDREWWNEKRAWVAKRVLDLDPSDLDANDAMGRRALQRLEGFDKTWNAMLASRAPTPDIDALLEQYDPFVQTGRPYFLTEEEVEVLTARLRKVGEYLARLNNDKKFASLQTALSQVRRNPLLKGYPFVHKVVGPFLIFYTARDLQRIPGEDEAAEDARIASRADAYRHYLDRLKGVYEGVLVDLRRRYPELADYHVRTERELFCQWIFAEYESFADHAERTRKSGAARPYRLGYYNGKDRWAYFFQLEEQEAATLGEGTDTARSAPAGSDPVFETAAYLAVTQILNRWGVDAKDRTINHLQRSRALWLREGLASLLAARRVKQPAVGSVLRTAKKFRWDLPRIQSVVECPSWFDLRLYQAPVSNIPPEEAERRQLPLTRTGVYPDMAWLLVDTLHGAEYRERLIRFLRGQIDGSGGGGGIAAFEKSFGIENEGGWAALELSLRDRWDKLEEDG